MTSESKKSLLLVIRQSPYGSGLAKAALDTGLAAAAFDQTVDLLFLGDGVLQLFPDQDGHLVGTKTIGRQLASLPLYDVNAVYVDARAVEAYKLDIALSPVPAKPLDEDQVHRLMSTADHLLGF